MNNTRMYFMDSVSSRPLHHSGLVAEDGLSRVHTSAVAVHTLKVGLV